MTMIGNMEGGIYASTLLSVSKEGRRVEITGSLTLLGLEFQNSKSHYSILNYISGLIHGSLVISVTGRILLLPQLAHKERLCQL